MNIPIGGQSLFLVWGPPSAGPRSRVFSKELGIEELHYIYSTTRQGLLVAPIKYCYQAAHTMRLLFLKRPRIVFVQSPPSFAVLFVYLYCSLAGSQYFIDAHSSAFQLPIWTHPKGLYRFLARKAVTTIVTNEHYQQEVMSWGGHAFILRDIPTTFPAAKSYPLEGSFNIVFVNTFSEDEPLDKVLEAAAGLEDVHFYITGKKNLAGEKILNQAPQNVHFTGFLPDDLYYALMKSSHAVMCLTTHNHTMQRGACEALSMGKPIITSNWPLLRDYFCNGTVHVQNTNEGIRQGVLELISNYDRYLAGIKELQTHQRQEWKRNAEELRCLVLQSVSSSRVS